MLAFRPSALALVLLTLSSCAYAPGGKDFPWNINFSGFVCNENSSQLLEGVDWKQAKVLDLRIRQGHFSPTYLGLYIDQPYLLNIENADDVDHSFMAFDFFRAIAVAGVSAGGADFKEIKCIAGVTIPPKTVTSLRIVAVRDGTYEFDDSSIINSLAMTGSGGGFITIEPRRNVKKSLTEQSVLFNYKSVVLESERIKMNRLDGSNDQVLTLNSSAGEPSNESKTRELELPSKPPESAELKKAIESVARQTKAMSAMHTKDAKTVELEPPSKPSESAESKKPIDSVDRQTKATSATLKAPSFEEVFDEPFDRSVLDQTTEISSDGEVEVDKKNTKDKDPVINNTPIASEYDRGHTKQGIPRGYQLFEGPPADIYSDPPDSIRIQTDSNGASGDSGDDTLDSSG